MPTLLITGASSGIGKATVEWFSEKGWNVAATMRDPSRHADLGAMKGVKLYALDVTQPDQAEKVVSSVLKDFGSVDVLLNNAGYAEIGPFEAAEDKQIQKQFDTNVFGLMRLTRAVLPHFREKKSGTIINIASVGGRITFPLYSLYHSTKFAVEGFTESLHYELRQFGIKVKLIEPGTIKTDFYGRSQDLLHKEGLTTYDTYSAKVMPKMLAQGANAPGPEIVAKAVWKAARDKGWRIRYLVGREAFYVRLRRLIPSSWFFGLVRGSLEG